MKADWPGATGFWCSTAPFRRRRGGRDTAALARRLRLFLMMGVAALLLCASEARAEGRSWTWSRMDVGMQTTFIAITAIEWAQTIDFTQDPSSTILETNVIMGPEPSRARVNVYMPLAMLGHTAVAAALPHG